MGIRKKLVKLKNENYWLRWLWFKNLNRQAKKARQITDLEYINSNFIKSFKRKPDLENPTLFYEKLNWFKLNYKNPLMPFVSDKYEVRKYLEDIGYGYLLNDLIGVWDKIDDFDPKLLPNRFVLKASHASGTSWMEIVNNKTKINSKSFKLVISEWLKQKIDWLGREWHYGEMKPRVIAEKYLEDDTGELRDYKFHCFNGEAKFVNVCIGRFTKHKKFLCLDKNWNLLPYTNDALSLPPNYNIEKPHNINQMFKLAEDLSKPFPYVRVDFYNVNGKIYFGEFTFFDFAAFNGPYTLEAQEIIGNFLKLPKVIEEKE